MKKSIILLIIIFAGIFIASCAFNEVTYCPYCKSMNISKVENKTDIYKCDNCNKQFGAKTLP